jgi:S-adenosylmethionine:tRNA ribosyltransferase-isomerase
VKVAEFDFDLPEERIALRPAEPRDHARLLEVGRDGALSDHVFKDLPALLRAGDMLVFNDTRVIPARLIGVRRRGEASARVEIMLHQRLDERHWRAFLRPAKKVAAGETIAIGAGSQALSATLVARQEGGDVILAFDRESAALDAAIATLGALPLPPYIAGKRATDERDSGDYQTVYAREPGAVAAPTAGLHFTDDLLDHLNRSNVSTCFLTLHVGAGTFLPVKAEDTADHIMHAEWGMIDDTTADSLNAARARGGRIIAVGTTSLRLLESAADETGVIRPFSGETAIFITPGYRFRAVDGLVTNFHLPKSTLFMLVSAFCGLDCMQAAYLHAIDAGYRFYSYGDGSLLWRG